MANFDSIPNGDALRAEMGAGPRVGERLEAEPSIGGLPASILQQRHPGYDGAHWQLLRALYRGGSSLLRNETVMRMAFPPHRQEHQQVYRERCKRAFYVAYCGEIVGDLVASMCRKPVEPMIGESVPVEYADLLKDVSPPGGKKTTFDETVREATRTAMQVRTTWVRVDMPKPPGEAPDNLAQQEESGALEPFCVDVPAESVLDWEESDDGELLWAIVYNESSPRGGLAGKRDRITHQWMYYDSVSWSKFEITRKKSQPIDDATVIPMVDAGVHTFGRVPFVRLQLPHDLWVMEKLESPAREHFNKRSGLAWGELQSLLPELYEFLAPMDTGGSKVIGELEEDPDRAINQSRGQGFIQRRTANDDAKYVGPDVGAFSQAMASCKELRDEMHRVTHQMALTIDNSAAALGRSAESKTADQAAKNTVLHAIAEVARKFAVDLLDMFSRGRGDTDLIGKWTVKGLDDFDPVARPNLIAEASEMELIKVPSATFQRQYKMEIARSLLPNATPETLKEIEFELEKNITADMFTGMAETGDGDAGEGKKPVKPTGERGDDAEEA